MKNEEKQEQINNVLENSNKNLTFAIFISSAIFLFIFIFTNLSYINNLNSRIKFLEENNQNLLANNLKLEEKLLDFILTSTINFVDINQTSTTGNNTNNLFRKEDLEPNLDEEINNSLRKGQK